MIIICRGPFKLFRKAALHAPKTMRGDLTVSMFAENAIPILEYTTIPLPGPHVQARAQVEHKLALLHTLVVFPAELKDKIVASRARICNGERGALAHLPAQEQE